ncbi:MAG TPA: hypothetical protein VNL77_23060 [Roseiflexaceae bacterium]|nr:hypothetical protein [Roseiflexaceae bacterium]
MQRYPVALYFALAFTVTWGGILLAVGPEGIARGGSLGDRVAPLVFLAMIAGPSTAGILLTGVIDAAGLWIVVAMVAWAEGRGFVRRPLRAQPT